MTRLVQLLALIPIALALLLIAFIFVVASAIATALHAGLEWLMQRPSNFWPNIKHHK